MNKKILEKKLEKVYLKYEKKLKSGGMSILVEDEKGEFSWHKETGDLKNDNLFCTASVTKMFTTVVVLSLIDENKLSLCDKISTYLPKDMVDGIHIYKGKDYSYELTIEHLMTQTSGLPDYFSEALPGQCPIEQRIDKDGDVTLDDAVAITKRLSPHFAPGTKRKAYYSDINWDLLPVIIKNASGMSIEECFKKYIFEPLKLSKTYLFTDKSTFDFPGIFVKDKVCKIPKLLTGWPASGGIISTNAEMVVFLKAFWMGKLFDNIHFEKIRTYRPTQYFPMKYGMGTMGWHYPGVPNLIGHSGATGVICYYAPKYRMYISGCINEMDEVKATQLLANMARCFKKSSN